MSTCIRTEALFMLTSIFLLTYPACTSTGRQPADLLLDPITPGCPQTQIVNKCEEAGCDWNDQDTEQLLKSRKVCKRMFGPEQCLRKITKVRNRGYTVVCRKAI